MYAYWIVWVTDVWLGLWEFLRLSGSFRVIRGCKLEKAISYKYRQILSALAKKAEIKKKFKI